MQSAMEPCRSQRPSRAGGGAWPYLPRPQGLAGEHSLCPLRVTILLLRGHRSWTNSPNHTQRFIAQAVETKALLLPASTRCLPRQGLLLLHTCRHSAHQGNTPQGPETAGQQSQERRIWENPVVESSLLNTKRENALLSRSLQGLSAPHSLALGPGSFHPQVLRGRQSSRGTGASTLPAPGPQVQSLESPAWLGQPLGLLARRAPGSPGGQCLLQPRPSSRLQLPGEAGQLPLVVDDLQLLDVSPGAGGTPGAQGLLRAWGAGRAVSTL